MNGLPAYAHATGRMVGRAEGHEAGEIAAYEAALAAILDCHTRIVAKHVPSPRVRRVRAGYRDRSLRAALALRSDRR